MTDKTATITSLTAAQKKALTIIDGDRKSGAFWHALGVAYKTLEILHDKELLGCETYGNSRPSQWVYWKL